MTQLHEGNLGGRSELVVDNDFGRKSGGEVEVLSFTDVAQNFTSDHRVTPGVTITDLYIREFNRIKGVLNPRPGGSIGASVTGAD